MTPGPGRTGRSRSPGPSAAARAGRPATVSVQVRGCCRVLPEASVTLASLAQSRDALADYIEAAERVGGESYPPLGLTQPA